MITSELEAIEEAVIEEMNRRCALPGQDDDHMRYDDTQIGIEFAFALLRDRFSTAAIALLPAEPVQDTYFTDSRLPVMALSGDIESNRVMKLHFRRQVNDSDRKYLIDALNAYHASLVSPIPHSSPEPTKAPINLDEEWETFNSRRFLHGHRETMRESFDAIFRDAFPAAVSLLESTADSRIAELEQQIANIKASRDLHATITADEEERARKAEAQRETYEEILRVVCHHLELPQSESGPADDLSLYDRALEQADVMYSQTEAERVEHMNARYKAESEVVRLEANIKRLTSNPADYRYWEGRWRDSEAKLAEAVKVIEYYADPEIYRPHPHGLAFDRRDLSFSAKSFLSKLEASHAEA